MMNFNQNALNALMEGNDDEEWGALEPDFATMLLTTDIGEEMFGLPPQLLHYAVTEIFRREDMYDDSDSASCSSTSTSDYEEFPAGAPSRGLRSRAFQRITLAPSIFAGGKRKRSDAPQRERI